MASTTSGFHENVATVPNWARDASVEWARPHDFGIAKENQRRGSTRQRRHNGGFIETWRDTKLVEVAPHEFGIAKTTSPHGPRSTRISPFVSVTLTPGRSRKNLMSESESVDEKMPLM
jgi:hypothetical protein